jgi:GNAT superfamily N-acetyltransferase
VSGFPDRYQIAGLTLTHEFAPGDLGELVAIHGRENFIDYGFDPHHEAYCALIGAEFLLEPQPRTCLWLVKKGNEVVGSVIIFERGENIAQLRLLFVARSARGIGLGRWLVEVAVSYCVSTGFQHVYLWTVDGLDRAISIYQSLGFRPTEKKVSSEWGRDSTEIRYDLDLPNPQVRR